jgi:hypothetical protein
VASAAAADTIIVIPPNPTASTPVTLHISGVSPVSAPISLHAFSIVGPTVRVEGCIPAAFETPSSYEFFVSVGTLAKGSYLIDYYTVFCGQSGIPFGPYFPEGTLNFDVGASGGSFADTSIPTLQPAALFALGVLVALGAFLGRTRRYWGRR